MVKVWFPDLGTVCFVFYRYACLFTGTIILFTDRNVPAFLVLYYTTKVTGMVRFYLYHSDFTEHLLD